MVTEKSIIFTCLDAGADFLSSLFGDVLVNQYWQWDREVNLSLLC